MGGCELGVMGERRIRGEGGDLRRRPVPGLPVPEGILPRAATLGSKCGDAGGCSIARTGGEMRLGRNPGHFPKGHGEYMGEQFAYNFG